MESNVPKASWQEMSRRDMHLQRPGHRQRVCGKVSTRQWQLSVRACCLLLCLQFQNTRRRKSGHSVNPEVDTAAAAARRAVPSFVAGIRINNESILSPYMPGHLQQQQPGAASWRFGESGIYFLARRTKESTTAVCFVIGRMLKWTVKICLSIIMATTPANNIDIIT